MNTTGRKALSSYNARGTERRKGPQSRVTRREAELIRLAASDITDKQIAQSLGITRDTVATYWKRLKEKFHKQTRTGLVAYLLEGSVGDVGYNVGGLDWSDLLLGISRDSDVPTDLKTSGFEHLNCGVVIEFPAGAVHYQNPLATKLIAQSVRPAAGADPIPFDIVEELSRGSLKTPIGEDLSRLRLPFMAGQAKGALWLIWAPDTKLEALPSRSGGESFGTASTVAASPGATRGSGSKALRTKPSAWKPSVGASPLPFTHAVIEKADSQADEVNGLCAEVAPLLIGTSREMIPFVLRGILRSFCEGTLSDVSIVLSNDSDSGGWKPIALWRRDAQHKLSVEDDLSGRHFPPTAIRNRGSGEFEGMLYQEMADAAHEEWSLICPLEYEGTFIGLWLIGGFSAGASADLFRECQLELFARCIAGAVYRTQPL